MNKPYIKIIHIVVLFFWMLKTYACPIGDGSALFKPVTLPKAFITQKTGAHPFSLIEPTNYAVTNHGHIYVIDSVAGQVTIVTAQGKALQYFATQGHQPGELFKAKGLALDAKNNVFIADTGNHRIQRFDHQGRFIKAWGHFGDGEDQLNQPTGIAVDEQFVYVSDTGNNRIVVYTKNGQFIRSFGQYGNSDTAFNQPVGIATDGYGNLYIADSQNNQIKKYSRNGKFYQAWGASGHLPGQLSTPFGISIYQGLLYIAELGNHRIQIFKENGEYARALTLAHMQLKSTASIVNPAPLSSVTTINAADIRVHYPASFAVSPNGLYRVMCEPQLITCSAYKESKPVATAIMEDSARWESGPSQYHYASAIAVKGRTIAVLNAEEHRISLFNRDNKKTKLVSQLGGFGLQAGAFKSPTSLAINSSGTMLAVSDTHNHRIQIFRLVKNKKGDLTDAHFAMSVGMFGHHKGQFNTPTKIQFDRGDNLHVLDSLNQRIQIFDKKLIFKQSYPLRLSEMAQFSVSDFFVVNKSKKIYINTQDQTLDIVDKNNNLVQKMGARSLKHRKRQMQEDRFVSPSHVAVDNNSNIYVTDQVGQKIKKFNRQGQYVASWGEWGSGQREFYKPKSLVVDNNILYVVDYGNYRVQLLDLSGRYLSEFTIGQRL